jgi:nicotinamidase-related amidase
LAGRLFCTWFNVCFTATGLALAVRFTIAGRLFCAGLNGLLHRNRLAWRTFHIAGRLVLTWFNVCFTATGLALAVRFTIGRAVGFEPG